MFEPVPATVDQVLDPAWLSAALGQQYDGCQVEDVTVLTQFATIASKLRLELSYRNPGTPAAPRRVIVKGYFGDAAGLGSAGLSEALFYRELAQIVDVHVPHCHYVGLDSDSGSSLLLIEDLARPGTELRTALQPFSPAESAAALDQLAALHATELKPGTLDQDWLASRAAPMAERVSIERLQELLDWPRGDGLPKEVRSGRRVSEAMRALDAEIPSNPCLLHGDTHSGNIYLENGAAGLFDWQLAQRGSWALDVSYHIASVLETEDRRRYEDELLRGYLDHRAALGAPVVDPANAKDAYRRHLAYGYFLWSMTQFTPEPITTATVRRLGHAVADHDTFGLLGV
jgi:aminoglycoside phosphotransferase (APT) family kinase protein